MDSKKALFNKILIAIILLIPIIFYGWRIRLRSPLTNIQQQLFPGVTYERKISSQPRYLVTHTVEIDLKTSKMQPVITESKMDQGKGSTLAMTTSEFAKKYDADLAINGSFFYPFSEDNPWDYYPYSGDLVYSLGENIINGKRYGKVSQQWNVLCFAASGLAQIPRSQSCSDDTVWGIAGMQMLLKNGKNIAPENPAYARTAVGINRQGDKLWLVLVDGKQPYYSEGLTLKELGDILANLGCDRALNLDGGGSSTLVVKQSNKINVLNAPIHTKIPMRERPVANHLGFKISS